MSADIVERRLSRLENIAEEMDRYGDKDDAEIMRWAITNLRGEGLPAVKIANEADWQPIDGRPLLLWDGFYVFEGVWNGSWQTHEGLSPRPHIKAWRPMPSPPDRSRHSPPASTETGK